MSTRDELLETIANTIKDYRVGEIAEPTPGHVDHWARQFSEAVQIPLLSELSHLLAKTYFSKEDVSGFFAHQIHHEKLAGTNPCAFWKQANILNIQQHGNSQKEILVLFGQSLKTHCGFAVEDCGSENGPFTALKKRCCTACFDSHSVMATKVFTVQL